MISQFINATCKCTLFSTLRALYSKSKICEACTVFGYYASVYYFMGCLIRGLSAQIVKLQRNTKRRHTGGEEHILSAPKHGTCSLLCYVVQTIPTLAPDILGKLYTDQDMPCKISENGRAESKDLLQDRDRPARLEDWVMSTF